MSLKLKLLAIVLFVGVVPVMVSTATGLSIHRSAYDRTVVESRRDTAERAAALVRQRFQAEPASLALLLLDKEGRLLCRGEKGGDLTGADSALLAALRGPGTRDARYRDAASGEMLAAAADAGHGWMVVARQPTRTAYAASRRILVQS